jgi:hypothetical protein
MSAVANLIDDVRSAVGRGDRYSRLRLLIAGVLGADVVLSLLLVAVTTVVSLDVGARVVEGFPSNLLMLQNAGGALTDAEVVIDERYTARVRELPHGALGLELDREFRDASDTPPPRDYRPRSVRVKVGAASVDIDLVPKR